MSGRILLYPIKDLSEMTGDTYCHLAVSDETGATTHQAAIGKKKITHILTLLGCSEHVIDRFLQQPTLIEQTVPEDVFQAIPRLIA